MFDLNVFLKELDKVYSKGPDELEEYLVGGVNEAKSNNDSGAALVILNELMGLYRVLNRFEECTKCADEVLKLSKELKIEGSVNYGTVLLNVATAYRVMHRYDEAENYYNQVKEIFENNFTNADYRMATLYNNISLLYSETGRLEQAKEQLFLAMNVISKLDEAEVEIAITHINLGNLCFALHQNDEGVEHMQTAVEIFENSGSTNDSHYASALSGLGEAYFSSGQLEKSIECYEKALTEIERHYGKNDYYDVTLENLSVVRDTLERKNAVLNGDMNGMKLSQLYYKTYGEPMLKQKYADYFDKITVGLVGEGSECFGFDDEYSTDHDFGPSFCMWLDKDLYDKIGNELNEDYNNLPKEFMGFKARNVIATGVGRVGAVETNHFYKNILGFDLPNCDRDWHLIPQEFLATATNGKIFKSADSEFLNIRNKISYYPKNVRLQKLAISLGQMAQTGQVNYARMLKRGDVGAAALCINEFVNCAIECVYILNSKYKPYYKWQFRGMDELEILSDVKPIILKILSSNAQDSSMQQYIETICDMVVCELNSQKLSNKKDSFLEIQKNEVLKLADE
jgi:tetratricopeptide (TPR) repeat protein